MLDKIKIEEITFQDFQDFIDEDDRIDEDDIGFIRELIKVSFDKLHTNVSCVFFYSIEIRWTSKG